MAILINNLFHPTALVPTQQGIVLVVVPSGSGYDLEVQRTIDDGGFLPSPCGSLWQTRWTVKAADVNEAGTTFTDTSVIPGQTYWYQAAQFNGATSSPWSSPVSSIPQVATITRLPVVSKAKIAAFAAMTQDSAGTILDEQVLDGTGRPVVAMFSKTLDTLDDISDGSDYAKVLGTSLNAGDVVAVPAGQQVNDGAGLANAVVRTQILQVQHAEVITYTEPYQNAPRVAFYNIVTYEAGDVWGTPSEITLQSGNTAAPLAGTARDNSQALNPTAVGCTVQARLVQYGDNPTGEGGSLGNVTSTTAGGAVYGAASGPQTELPSATGQYTIGWTSATGVRPVNVDKGSTTGEIVLVVQFSPDESTWTTLGFLTYTSTGGEDDEFSVGSQQTTLTSTVPAYNGYWRVGAEGTGLTTITGASITWNIAGGTTQYASMAPLTGSTYVTLEAFGT